MVITLKIAEGPPMLLLAGDAQLSGKLGTLPTCKYLR